MIRWGFLGAGNIATRALAPATHAAQGAVLAAVASRDPRRAEALGPQRVHANYRDLLADPDIDAVYISLANDAHLPWSIAALEAGKHVLCEKPLAMSAAEVQEMSAAAVASQCMLVEALWYRWHPRIRMAQQLIASGRIGSVREVNAVFGFAGVPSGNYRLDPKLGGGALYDVGCYCISAARWSFGGAPVVSVQATCERGATGVDLRSALALSFEGGGSAHVNCAVNRDLGQQLVISGDLGQIELVGSAFTSWVGQETQLLVTDERGTETIDVPSANAYQLMVEEMSSVVSGGSGWLVPAEDSLACAEVIDAALAMGLPGAHR